MEITINRDSLLQALQLVSGAVERRHTLPILSHVLLSVKGQQLQLMATDLEIELIGQTDVINSSGDAEITVPARKLVDICRSLASDADIELKLEKNRLLVKSGKSRFYLTTLPASEFPKISQDSINTSFVVTQSQLLHLMEKTAFAMAHQDVRYYLNGMLLNIEPDKMNVVATDGHRLALTEVKQPFDIKEKISVIVPRKAILELTRLLTDSEETVKLSLSTNHLHVECDDFSFVSKLVDGKFPDYNRVIPKQFDKFVMLDRDAFKQTLVRAAILSNEKYNGVRLTFTAQSLQIEANNPHQEEVQDEISIQYDGENLEIGFNVNYLIDALSALPVGDVKLSLLDSNSSILLEEPTGGQSLYVVMPMRL